MRFLASVRFMVCMGWRGHREGQVMMAQDRICDKNYFDTVCGDHLPYTVVTQGGVYMFTSSARSTRARRLPGTAHSVVLEHYPRSDVSPFSCPHRLERSVACACSRSNG